MKEKILSIIENVSYNIGLSVYDCNGTNLSINGDLEFESASTIKTFILVEYIKQVYEGKKSFDDKFTYTEEDNIKGVNSGIISSLDYGLNLTSKDYATLMIIYSDNIATNKIIDYLGIDNINKTIKELGFTDTFLFNNLNLLKYKRFGKTTANEYAGLFKMIYEKCIINENVSSQLLEILKKQKYNDMLCKALPQYDVLFKGSHESSIKYIASKSGSIIWTGMDMDNLRADGGIISTVFGDYIVSVFVSGFNDISFNYNNEGINIGSKICKIIYEEMKEKNDKI